ncbi:diaminopimelate epimerase [Paenibacillus vortex V453]|jgi:diaminopimelate epimerase|uniref:Diaminopimelate epimerase n=2 Tax=Paenibacillus TaxID=44249 RepID=A0A163L632_9BACL|nr:MULTISPECIES: diaminopimelate epimerase [Paenibacillus]ANA81804.1 diaminopimelate epimerase [Paenibacillus glucanolyticus]AVV59465.1 diaminopimelate epimerase [Paenibacillus glucanolyticus]AWP28646.1 diaminopimelate epimerase [Paenibacillus sp. Cedars]EFU41684.1 diaminopimelate epimerase [Paenibacillus vortex V453]ETT43221.1 diaminopimelate epimerase [Paenibacillus sp. FSL R5-808]
MEFTKMHGLGNDFVVVYGEQELPNDASERAVKLCHRFFGIGADGLVYILPSRKADFMMRIMNSDGSEAEQCGNAIRCVAKYVYDHGHINREEITIETIGAGVQQVRLTVQDGQVSSVRVDMGEPVLNGLSVPTTIDLNPVVDHPVEVDGREFRFTAVSMGNPHCVIYVDDAVNFDLGTWGPKLEVHPLFPRKINVEFATVNSRDQVDMRVWERGAGPTLACGTGACATLVSSVLNGSTDRSATISLKGGDLFIEWDENDNHVYMTGPAELVYKGTLAI